MHEGGPILVERVKKMTPEIGTKFGEIVLDMLQIINPLALYPLLRNNVLRRHPLSYMKPHITRSCNDFYELPEVLNRDN